jgi:uncharacterized protein (TIGR02246 family)
MRKWKLVGWTCGLAAVVAMGLVLGLGNAPAGAAGAKDKDNPEPGKGKRAQAFIEAFNNGDAKTLSMFWTEAGDYVDQVGHSYKGREAIQKMYEKFFAGHKGAKLEIHVLSKRDVTPDVAIEDGITTVTMPDGGPPSVAAFTAVGVKKEGEWYFESVRDSIARPPSNAKRFEDLDWLIGDWAGEDKGQSGTASYEWAENQNFIVCHFATTLNGIPVVGGTQWICWDAIDKKVRSFSFYSGGGFGEAEWTKEGDKLVIRTTAKTAAGQKASATNIITKKDDDHAVWQVTHLMVGDKEIPDPPPQNLKRVKEEKPADGK